jgi:hypothetical protein
VVGVRQPTEDKLPALNVGHFLPRFCFPSLPSFPFVNLFGTLRASACDFFFSPAWPRGFPFLESGNSIPGCCLSTIFRVPKDVDESLRKTHHPIVLDPGSGVEVGVLAAIRFNARIGDFYQKQDLVEQRMPVAIGPNFHPYHVGMRRGILLGNADRIFRANFYQLLDRGFSAPIIQS